MQGKEVYRPKKRNSYTRRRNSIILIAAEGKNKTETQYFQDLSRDRNVIIRFAKGNWTDPVNLARALEKEYTDCGLDKRNNDKAFCLVDSDVDPAKNKQLAEAETILKKAALIVSSPCFEVWCLCHFHSNSTYYRSSEDVVTALVKKIPGYKKNGEGLYGILSDRTLTAVENAKKLEETCRSAGYQYHTVDFSPSTEIYKVIETILEIEKKERK